MSSVAEIPINKHLGMSYNEKTNSLSLPDTDITKNHFGQVSFCAQFTLAESASAQYLFENQGMSLETDLPTLRNATTKFHKTTMGTHYVILFLLSTLKRNSNHYLMKKVKF